MTESKNKPDQTPAERNWQFPLTMGLSIGIGVTLARHVVAVLWPSLDDTWGVMPVNAAMAGLMSGVVASVLGGLLKLFGKAKPAQPADAPSSQNTSSV